jgi:MFS family permease
VKLKGDPEGVTTVNGAISRGSAIKFVVLIGVISLFSDMTYEGARSITGPYLAILGASAKIVGIVAGIGEFIGYGFRLVSGYIADRTGRYWTITITGYVINLLAVPLLAIAGRWEVATLLIITERLGKAIRTPSRDAILSHATKEMGRGWGFGLHEAMDQIGAILGPLIVACVIYFRGGYRLGFAILFIPALIALCVLLLARFLYPSPGDLEPSLSKLERRGFQRSFYLYLAAVAMIAAGYADFPLIAYHFKNRSTALDEWIPLFYAIAMGIDAISALVLGRLYDRFGIIILAFIIPLSSFFAPLVFLGGFYLSLFGMALWGVGMGAQESIVRAQIADMTPTDKRGSAYGIFNTGYGLFWFMGSALMGVLYDISIPYLIIFSMLIQLASIPLLIKNRERKKF